MVNKHSDWQFVIIVDKENIRMVIVNLSFLMIPLLKVKLVEKYFFLLVYF